MNVTTSVATTVATSMINTVTTTVTCGPSSTPPAGWPPGITYPFLALGTNDQWICSWASNAPVPDGWPAGYAWPPGSTYILTPLTAAASETAPAVSVSRSNNQDNTDNNTNIGLILGLVIGIVCGLIILTSMVLWYKGVFRNDKKQINGVNDNVRMEDTVQWTNFQRSFNRDHHDPEILSMGLRTGPQPLNDHTFATEGDGFLNEGLGGLPTQEFMIAALMQAAPHSRMHSNLQYKQ
ncbi:hypothetical protein HK100_002110 [Physocladia obscura]|uniref:Uncharacterized protein n=1 Tax=Physocladia obscura TaxID=109957 RepID=A0AAD5XLG8_9FUNG|nr:hypothetical protein HK100_002110 [Physocladia obscura]